MTLGPAVFVPKSAGISGGIHYVESSASTKQNINTQQQATRQLKGGTNGFPGEAYSRMRMQDSEKGKVWGETAFSKTLRISRFFFKRYKFIHEKNPHMGLSKIFQNTF